MWNLYFIHCWSQRKSSNVCYVWTCLLHVPSGKMLSDDMLNLMVLRYGASSGHMSLENFISLLFRLDCMNSEWSPTTKVHPLVQGCWKPVLINPAGFSVLQLSVGQVFYMVVRKTWLGFCPRGLGFHIPALVGLMTILLWSTEIFKSLSDGTRMNLRESEVRKTKDKDKIQLKIQRISWLTLCDATPRWFLNYLMQ